jgi:hypothetical protein
VKSVTPRVITLVPDEHRTQHVGWTENGAQVFLTTPFIPAFGTNGGREFLALYIFDGWGYLTEARIEDLGARAELNVDEARAQREQWWLDLGPIRRKPIFIRPFQMARYDTTFGLIRRPPEEEDEGWTVTAEPGGYLGFLAPWDGTYDT